MRLGIIGGLGPETSCKFCLDLNVAVKARTGSQPDILLDNLPVSDEVEKKNIRGRPPPEMLEMMKDSVARLTGAGADVICIPCNTVHVFIDELRRASDLPVISIIEEASKEMLLQGFERVGILGTDTTVRAGLFQKGLGDIGIETVLPDADDQKKVTSLILRILDRKAEAVDGMILKDVMQALERKGAEAILLSCTDLQHVALHSEVPVLDTAEILKEAIVQRMTGGEDERTRETEKHR